MGTKLFLSVPGPPVGKARARRAANGRMYTPQPTVDAENFIRGLFRQKYPRHRPFTGPVMVRFTAVFAMPKGLTAAARQAAIDGRLYHTGTPDKENIEKLIWDALNRLAWVDDGQCQGGGIKRYGEPERIDIEIEELEGLPETPSDRRRRREIEQRRFAFPK